MKIENDQYKGIGPLFDICANKHQGNPMSVQANKIASKGKPSIRALIMATFMSHTRDWTCEELEEYSRLPHQTLSARLSELRRVSYSFN